MNIEEFDNDIISSFDIVDPTEVVELDSVSDSIDEKLEQLQKVENNINFNQINISMNDLATADNNAVKGADENPEFANMVNKVADKYNQQYDTNVSYDDLQEYLLSRAQKSEKEKQIETVVKEEIAQEAINYLENKYLLVLAKFLDSQMNQMLRTDIANNISEESIALTDRLLMMRKELDKLSNKFKGGGDVRSKLDNIKGKDVNAFDEETMKTINLLKEATLKKYADQEKELSSPF